MVIGEPYRKISVENPKNYTKREHQIKVQFSITYFYFNTLGYLHYIPYYCTKYLQNIYDSI